MLKKENLKNLSSYILDGEMFINVNMGQTERTQKPSMKEMAQEHYRIKTETIKLSDFAEALGKGRAFFAGKFKRGKDGKVHYSKECLTQSGMIIMDIDNGLYDIEDVHGFLKENGIEPNIIYESFSYSKSNPRFRIIWVVGDMEEKSIIEDLSKLTYELLKKWSSIWKMNKEKVVHHVVTVKNSKNEINTEYKNIILEEDKASNNSVQMWQGTKNGVYLYHQEYSNIADFVNVFYSLSSKGNERRITDTLRNKCNIGCIGYIGDRNYKEMSSNYYEHRGIITQTSLKTPDNEMEKEIGYNDKKETISIWGFKQDIDKNIKKPKIEYSDEEYIDGEVNLLLSRCQLMRELQSNQPHWIDDGGYKVKFKIVTNLKFIPGGEDLMYDTICKHSDRSEKSWEQTFERIKISVPPVPCSEFCPYRHSCKYGKCSIAFASQKHSWKNDKVVTKVSVEEISLIEAQAKVKKFVSESLDAYKDNREIFEGWEYGTRRKFHHMGLNELRQYHDETLKKIANLREILKNTFSVNGIPQYEIRDFREDSQDLINYLNKNNIKTRFQLIKEIQEIQSRLSKRDQLKVDIDQRRYDMRDKLDVISVPVGVGKTRSLIDSICDKIQKEKIIPHIAYAAPSHKLAAEFERDLLKELRVRKFSISDINSFKILRLIPRPELPSLKEEMEIKNLENLGITVSRKMKEYMESYKIKLETGLISSTKRDKVRQFCWDCEKYLDNRSESRKANILITTHTYIQKSYFQLFDNIDIVFFDEDLCKTSTSQFVLSVSQILKMKDNLKKASYEYNGGRFGFNDLIDICDYILTSESDKIITFNSSNYLCSEIKELKGEEKVVDYMVDKKFSELSRMRQEDKINYFKLCNIKSFIRHNDKIFFGTYEEINIGNKPLVMLSANPSPISILEKLTGRSNITIKDTGYVKQEGSIKQCINIGASRSDLDNPEYIEKIKEIISKENPGCKEIITYKKYKELFSDYNCEMHLGATSGLNSLMGKDISVVGTYHLPAIAVNVFSGMFKEDGAVSNLELPSFRKITYRGIEQKISTYSRGLNQDYHLWYIYDELEQASGRSRCCRTSATVLLFCQLQHPQAEIINEKIYIKREELSQEEKERRFDENFNSYEEEPFDISKIEEDEEEKTPMYIGNDEDDSLPF